MKTAFSLLAMTCSLSAGVVYIVSIFKGPTRPQRITWLLWSILGVVYLLSAIRSQGNVIYSTAALFQPFIIFLLALKFGVGGRSRLDLISLAIAFFALILLGFTKSPVTSILLCLFVDAIGAALTIRKIILDPGSEPRVMWLISACGGAFALLGLHSYGLANVLFPGYIAILGVITFILVSIPGNNAH